MSKIDDAISTLVYVTDCLKVLNEIWSTGDCNNCKNKLACEYVPEPGALTRYNCPHYVGKAKRS